MPRGRSKGAVSAPSATAAEGSRGGRTRSHRRGAGDRPSTTIHADGTAEVIFQVQLDSYEPPPTSSDPMPDTGLLFQEPNTITDRQPHLSSIPERQEATSQTHNSARNSPSNPFRSRDEHVAARGGEFIIRATTPSTEGEEFPNPSPTSSIGRGAPSQHQRGSPRAGRHSVVSPSVRRNVHQGRKAKGNRTPDVWNFFEKGGAVDEQTQGPIKVWVCKLCQHQHGINPRHTVSTFSITNSTSTLRSHLASQHVELWVDACDSLSIKITATAVQQAVQAYRERRGVQEEPEAGANPLRKIPEYSGEAFAHAIMEFIIANDQSINVIESPQLRAIFLMLREELRDSDIPHRTTIRNHITETWEKYIDELTENFKDTAGRISMTTDLWTDPNLSPFMAVTAHWIETEKFDTPEGPQYKLKLRADLIGFRQVPGSHDGEHLANAFLAIIDRLGMASKIGWITVDNASNNDTFMSYLQIELSYRGIPFNHTERRIRCFPHIVNLACKAIISVFSDLDCHRDIPAHMFSSLSDPEETDTIAMLFQDAAQATDSGDDDDWDITNMTTTHTDPIGALRALVRAIRASSLRCQKFSEIAEKAGRKLQLLHDVDTRWSSTFYMIKRALHLLLPLDQFLKSREGTDIQKQRLSPPQLRGLLVAYRILEVPDAFLQMLSSEKTPTLCNALPAFDALLRAWRVMRDDDRWGQKVQDVIQDGINKIEGYQARIEHIPAYILTMLFNPAMKLRFIPEAKHVTVKLLLRTTLLPYYRKRTGVRTQPQPNQPDIQPRPTARNRAPADYTPSRVHNLRLGSFAIGGRTASEILGIGPPPTTLQHGFESLDAEIALYFADTRIGIDSISYWQENQLRFPTFFLAALDYLAIQGSAVPCERVFSSAKETMTERHNCIHPDLMEMLQMLKFAMRSGEYIVGTLPHKLEAWLEEQNELLDEVPDGIDEYIQTLLSKST